MKISLLAFCLLLPCLAGAEPPRALPPGELPKDARLAPLKDLDGYFPFTPPASPQAWQPRAERVRMQMRVALGLWPEPTRTPLNAVVHGRTEQEDYSVEKVFFESMPGFFVTGTLFRPKGKPGPHPAVLCPHGHWKDARMMLFGEAEMKKELESGGERLPVGGRSIFQSLGVQLARMGCVAFVYDMLGDSDSQQLSRELVHGFAKQRPAMNARENWGLFSPPAEAHAQSVMGLQTWDSIRAVDFLLTLPEVDPQRIAATGASGGGTQTMVLAALDPRIAVECPAVMVSTSMQGGCTCENASLLRIGTGNIEFAALFAPKPLGMTAANDWTKEMETKGFPELKQHYAMMGAPKNVALWPLLHFGHNYNAPSRAEICKWFNQHFALGLSDAQLTEREYPVLTREQLTVWNAEHPAPKGGEDFERGLLRWWHDDAQAQWAKEIDVFYQVAASAWGTLIGWRGLPKTQLEHVRELELRGGGKSYRARLSTLRASDGSFELPQLAIAAPEASERTALWLDERGKAGLFTANGELRSEVCQLLERGIAVVGADLFGQGEFLPDGKPITATRTVKNPREAAAYTHGYNPSLFAQRVHDICTLIESTNPNDDDAGWSLIALDGTGPLAAVATGVLDCIESAALRTNGFRFGHVSDLRDPHFLPAAAKYGDLPGALALSTVRHRTPPRLYLLGEKGTAPALVEAAYRDHDALDRLRVMKEDDVAATIRGVIDGK